MLKLDDTPAAYLVPELLDFRGKRHSLSDADAETFQGTVVWRPLLLVDGAGHGVTDKFGVTHYPEPLYRKARVAPEGDRHEP